MNKEKFIMNAVLISKESGEIHTIPDQDEFYIGRGTADPANMLQIDSEEISRKHAVIMKAGDYYQVEDNCSKNGTYVNGKLLKQREKMKLFSGDSISFSGLNYIFKSADTDFSPVEPTQINGVKEEANGRIKILMEFSASEVSLYQIKMLMHNTERGFLKMNFIKIEEEYRIYYDTEGLTQLNQFILNESRDEGDFYKILYNIVMAIRSTDALFIKTQNLYLKADGIYIDPNNLAVKLLFMPKPDKYQDVYVCLISILQEFERRYAGQDLIDFTLMKTVLDKRSYGMDGLSIILMEQEKVYRQLQITEKRYFAVKETDKQTQDQITKALSGFQPLNLHLPNLDNKQKLYIIQAVLVLGLTGIFASGLFKAIDFFGFAIVVIGVDLWLMRSFRLL